MVCSSMKEQPDKTTEFIESLKQKGFWGSVTLKFEAGKITHLKQEKNLKPHDLERELQ